MFNEHRYSRRNVYGFESERIRISDAFTDRLKQSTVVSTLEVPTVRNPRFESDSNLSAQ